MTSLVFVNNEIYGQLWGPHYGLRLWLARPSKSVAHYRATTMACGYDWPDHPNLWPTMGPPLWLVFMTGHTIQIYGPLWGPHYGMWLWLTRPSKSMAHYGSPTIACIYDWPDHPNLWPTMRPPLWLVVMTGQTIQIYGSILQGSNIRDISLEWRGLVYPFCKNIIPVAVVFCSKKK